MTFIFANEFEISIIKLGKRFARFMISKILINSGDMIFQMQILQRKT